MVLIIFVEEIAKSFVVEFKIGNGDLDLVFISGVDFLIKF